MKGPIRIAAISDIHLGHRNNDAASIIENLNRHITNDDFLSTIDLLVFVGDVFDEALSLSADAVQHIDFWISRTLKMCRKYGVIVRVLEGTPSHDRKQSQRFTIINEIHERTHGEGCDLKHVEELSIEHIEKFDINVLYVPDEWKGDVNVALQDFKDALAEKDLEEVDFAFMHGQFEYQLPAHIANMPRHSSEVYLSLVRYLIFIGHIHLYSRFKDIIAQGSFDRLGHNEEGPKGFVYALVLPDGNNEVKFIENVGARKYVTVNCPYEDPEENLRKIDAAVEKLPPQSNVRVEANKGNPILSNLMTLRVRWPLLSWASIAREEKVKEQELEIMPETALYVPIHITPDNITTLVLDRLLKKGITSSVLRRAETAMREMERI